MDFGVFGPAKKTPVTSPSKRQTHFAKPDGNTDGQQNGNGLEQESEEEEDGEDRQSRPVIKLRSTRHAIGRNLSRSRSRRDLSQAAEDDRRPSSPDPAEESVANVRFSAHIIAKTDLSALMPFALIAPEAGRRRQRPMSPDSRMLGTAPSTPVPQSEDGHVPSIDTVPKTPGSIHSAKNLSFLQGPPDDLKGVFTRNFRWGTVDVLDPNHCDFAALRTAVLSTHLKVRLFSTFHKLSG